MVFFYENWVDLPFVTSNLTIYKQNLSNSVSVSSGVWTEVLSETIPAFTFKEILGVSLFGYGAPTSASTSWSIRIKIDDTVRISKSCQNVNDALWGDPGQEYEPAELIVLQHFVHKNEGVWDPRKDATLSIEVYANQNVSFELTDCVIYGR